MKLGYKVSSSWYPFSYCHPFASQDPDVSISRPTETSFVRPVQKYPAARKDASHDLLFGPWQLSTCCSVVFGTLVPHLILFTLYRFCSPQNHCLPAVSTQVHALLSFWTTNFLDDFRLQLNNDSPIVSYSPYRDGPLSTGVEFDLRGLAWFDMGQPELLHWIKFSSIIIYWSNLDDYIWGYRHVSHSAV